jgi:hypothetical protein
MDEQNPSLTLPLSSKLPCIQSPVHINPGSFRLSSNHLNFQYSSQSTGHITCSFFMFEHGLSFIQDKKYSLSPQEIPLHKGKILEGSFSLNPDYGYEFSSSLPIVLQVHCPDFTEISVLEVKNSVPKVLQQRIITNNKMFEIREIINPPLEEMEERDKNCVICMSSPRNTIMEPCCHISICDDCANLMRTQVNRKCPMCRTGIIYLEVISFMKINFS